MNTNETENDGKSWSLYGSSDQSISSEPMHENFEEVSLDCYSENEDENPSYEIVDLDASQNESDHCLHSRDQVVQQLTQKEPLQVSLAQEEKLCLDDYIKNTAATLLDPKEKQQEIKTFEGLLRRFDKWVLEKRQKGNLRRRGPSREADYTDLEGPICKFFICNPNMSASILPFLDIYVNILVIKQAFRQKVQGLCVEFLRETEPQSFISENEPKNRNSHKKIIFKYAHGNTRFIITVGPDFRERLNVYIRVCTIIDERFLLIGAFLSFWAYKRKIFNGKYLSPYALYFMTIYFLMTRIPPILPTFNDDDLSKMNPSKSLSGMGGHPKPFIVYKEKPSTNSGASGICDISGKGRVSNNLSGVSLGDLATQFFQFYANEVPKLKKKLSVKRGAPVENNKRVEGYSLEDPFNPHYDLCKNLNDDRSASYKFVRKEFERGYNLLCEGKIQELCQE